jgi:Transglutaminase-like superfamily
MFMTNESGRPVTGFPEGFRRLAELSRAERRLFLAAVMWLGIFRAAILAIPFRRIAPHLGAHMTETPSREEGGERGQLAREVAQAVRRASRHVPWEAKCLVQALAGKKMLKSRGIASTLYLGLDKTADQDLLAHAWLRCGDQIILGDSGIQRFAVVSTFGHDSPGLKR